jgi:hypothetical protein
MLSGKDKLAKPEIKSEIGLVMEPKILTLDWSSTKRLINVIPQTRNINDSYKLLKGK